MNSTRPVALVVASTWWPSSAKLSIALIRHGCRVEAVCPPGHPLRYITGVRRYYSYRRLGSLHSLKRALYAAQPEIVVPCDDSVVLQLHQLYDEQPDLRELIQRSLGSATHFGVISSRQKLQQLASELRIRVPQNLAVKAPKDLAEWFENSPRKTVLKKDGTSGGDGICVVHTVAEAVERLTSMLRPSRWLTACKRCLVNRDPLAFWKTTSTDSGITAQEFIAGRPANLMMACWNGKVLGAITVEVLWGQGETGAAMVARIIDHEEINHVACRLAKALDLSGFHGLDFILEAETNAAYLLELNPRCTQLGHLPLGTHRDLASVLCEQLGIVPEPPADQEDRRLEAGDTVAFFPKALLSNPQSIFICNGYHDIPWQEPALIRELLDRSWPDRQWQARLYHSVRPQRRDNPVSFA
jgi:hypothetical protein